MIYNAKFAVYNKNGDYLGMGKIKTPASNILELSHLVNSIYVNQPVSSCDNLCLNSLVKPTEIISSAILNEATKEVKVEKYPRVGLAVLIVYKGKILLSKRISKHENGVYGLPGGKLDYGESFMSCVHREVMEETDLRIKNVITLPIVTNNIYKDTGRGEDSHYACFWFVAEPDVPPNWDGLVPYIEEDINGNPKSEGWKWHDVNYDALIQLPVMRGTAQVIKHVSFHDAIAGLNVPELKIIED